MFGPAFRVTAIAVAGLLPAFGHAAHALASIEVTAKQQSGARADIETQTGASTYRSDTGAIAATSKDNNTLLDDVILQAPQVARGSLGQFHRRGQCNHLQCRPSDMLLSEGPSVLKPRRVASVRLITGTLPPAYASRAADIIAPDTKSGLLDSGASISLYGGSHVELPPSITCSSGKRALQSMSSISSTTPPFWAAVCRCKPCIR